MKLKNRRTALAKDVFTSLSSINEKGRQAFWIFMSKFRIGTSMQFEDISGASAYQSYEFGESLSVLFQAKDDTYIILWLGRTEEAKAWAETHCCEVNERTGVVQVYVKAAKSHPKPAKIGLFASLPDEELLNIGLPQEKLELIRSLENISQLEEIQETLPSSVYEALTWFVQGESWADIVAAYREDAADEKAMVSTDIGKLDAGYFRIVETDEELRDIMDKPLAQWRVFLHPSQRKLVDNAWHGAVRVTGGAGTGKTVVALHRARHLVQMPDWTENDRLLFTTFTKNLAVDIEDQLKTICTRSEMKSVVVQNIDSWLATFLRQHGCDKTIVYPGKADSLYENAWNFAIEAGPKDLDFTNTFYRDEWEEVVLPSHCLTCRDYMFAPRLGRGTPLTRAQRKKIWPIFEEMRLQLTIQNAMTTEDAALLAVDYLTKIYPNGLYRAVIADEIQDFKPDTLRLLRAMAADVSKDIKGKQGDLFMVGDTHQRIYGHPFSFSSCGIDIRGRGRKLRVNYRTTDEIRRVAESVYSGKTVDNMDGADETPTGYASLRHGRQPITNVAADLDKEVEWIVKEIRTLTSGDKAYRLSDICVTVRTNTQLDEYERELRHARLETHRLSRTETDNSEHKGVRLATMHRIKGLEYKVVFVAGMNKGAFPLEIKNAGDRDAVSIKQAKRIEDALFYVACSRAVDMLFLTCNTEPGDYLKRR